MEFPRLKVDFTGAGRGPDFCATCGPPAPMAPFRPLGGFAMVRCGRCGLVSLAGATSAGVAVSETNEPFFSSDEFNRWFLSHEDYFRCRYRNDLAEIRELVPTGSLLDVGCGPGLFLDEARAAGWRVAGVEASASPATLARERFGLPVVTGTLEEADLTPGSFDVVTFFDVLEHLPHPRAVLEQAILLLRPQGLLVAQSPNRRSVMAWTTADRWRWYFLPNHLHHFTPSTLEGLLRSAGLVPIRTTTWDEPEEFAANLQDRFPGLGGGSRAKRLVRRALRASIRAGARVWASAGLGGLVRVFARKDSSA